MFTVLFYVLLYYFLYNTFDYVVPGVRIKIIIIVIKQNHSKGVQLNAPPAQKITVALDMSKAFHTINIHILIIKLLQTNIPGKSLI